MHTLVEQKRIHILPPIHQHHAIGKLLLSFRGWSLANRKDDSFASDSILTNRAKSARNVNWQIGSAWCPTVEEVGPRIEGTVNGLVVFSRCSGWCYQ